MTNRPRLGADIPGGYDSAVSLWDYPIRSDRECGATGAPGRHCVDLRDRLGRRPASDDLMCSYCGKTFEEAFEAAPRRADAEGDDRQPA